MGQPTKCAGRLIYLVCVDNAKCRKAKIQNAKFYIVQKAKNKNAKIYLAKIEMAKIHNAKSHNAKRHILLTYL